MTTNHLLLRGCAPTPLARYLKALGILRLVSEQVDDNVKGYWNNEDFVLITRLDSDDLKSFFIKDYQPTPLVAPWGARSGFFPGTSEKSAREALDAIANCTYPRLSAYKQTISQVQMLLQKLGLNTKAKDEEKLEFLKYCRAHLSDNILCWLDACYILTENGRKFPPLLGTGGNEGSGSYVAGFAQQVVSCIVHQKYDHALPNAIFGIPGFAIYADQTPGHFSPESAGWFNSGSGFEGQVSTNPWDYLLCLEGTVLFAAGVTRKLESSGQGELSYPFTVRSSGTGAGNAAPTDEINSRAEMWVPLWKNPISLSELKILLSEGRVNLGRRKVRDGLDFVRAIAALGMDRGIHAFHRYAFLQRQGQNYLSIPLNRINVHRNLSADLIDQLDKSNWLRRFKSKAREKTSPTRMQLLARRLEDSLFDMAQNSSPIRVQRVICALGAVQQYLSTNPKHQEDIPPVPQLSDQWVIAADDHTHEFRIAAALAGISAKGIPMGAHLAPIDPVKPWQWKSDSRMVVRTSGNLTSSLFSILERRLVETARHNNKDNPLSGWPPADKAAVAAFLAGETNDRFVFELLSGLVRTQMPSTPLPTRQINQDGIFPAAFRLLKPLFTTNRQLQKANLLASDQHLPLPLSLPRLLRAGRIQEAMDFSMRRLRASGLPSSFKCLHASGISGTRLAAALIIPMFTRDIVFLTSGILHNLSPVSNKGV